MTKGDAIQFFKDYVQRNQILVSYGVEPANPFNYKKRLAATIVITL